MLSRCVLDLSVGVGAFVIDLFLFLLTCIDVYTNKRTLLEEKKSQDENHLYDSLNVP